MNTTMKTEISNINEYNNKTEISNINEYNNEN